MSDKLSDDERARIRAVTIEECAKVCEAYAADQWSLYKGRAPYTGNEAGRADPDAQGRSDGADVCAERIRALAASPAPAISESEDARKTCMCSGLGPCERRTDGSCRVSAPANLASAISRHVVIDWAVERWTLEVSGRPLGNIQRRSLDDAWRQFIRYLGADDVSLLGPRHDDLIAAHSLSIPMPDSEGGEA
ncbi:hypothetical protein [Burkholderia glumae]|uniref:hypothetical protein n=1 Tax=Burkholderia glumae TaxID=337 RepID=UPI00214FC609|nr:hypothetical protein [Burkholderia glumae]